MSIAVLMTKLYMPPPRTALLSRPRLTEAVSRGLERPLLLLTAPAGFGKTTLLGEWRLSAAGRAFPLAWISLDSLDSDPAVFWTYVVAALRSLPGLADRHQLGKVTLELVQTGSRPSPAHFLAPLLNDLVGTATPFALVLDDFHAIDSPAIHEAMTYLVERLPPAMHLVLLTRADPPWPLARLRANARVAELWRWCATGWPEGVEMKGPVRYEVRVAGRLPGDWTDWFGGMVCRPDASGNTTLSGWVADQAALHGILARIRDLNLTLLGVRRLGSRVVR